MNGEIKGEVGNTKKKGTDDGGDGEWEDDDEDMEGLGGHIHGRSSGREILHAEEKGIIDEEVAGPRLHLEDDIS